MKYLKKINELNTDTYIKSAAKASVLGQDRLARKMMKFVNSKTKPSREVDGRI